MTVVAVPVPVAIVVTLIPVPALMTSGMFPSIAAIQRRNNAATQNKGGKTYGNEYFHNRLHPDKVVYL
jgi:FlaG/FlaF family flagellin (archaellin)